MLATIVGSANGRSMRALTMRLPGNSSRTRTQAMRVPITALTTATMAATRTVTRNEASATGAVTACQKPPTPSPSEVTVSAASGRSTSTLSQRPTRPTPSGRATPIRRREAAGGGGVASASSPRGSCGRGGRDDPSVEVSPLRARWVVVVIAVLRRGLVVDERDGPGLLLEERPVDRLPAAEVVDRPELGRLGEVGGEIGR